MASITIITPCADVPENFLDARRFFAASEVRTYYQYYAAFESSAAAAAPFPAKIDDWTDGS